MRNYSDGLMFAACKLELVTFTIQSISYSVKSESVCTLQGLSMAGRNHFQCVQLIAMTLSGPFCFHLARQNISLLSMESGGILREIL